jgi:hypothetical protein
LVINPPSKREKRSAPGMPFSMMRARSLMHPDKPSGHRQWLWWCPDRGLSPGKCADGSGDDNRGLSADQRGRN